MSDNSIIAREDEKTKLSERLKKELPPSVEFAWDERTGFLVFSKGDKSLTIEYGYPPYPNSDDIVKLMPRIKSKFIGS